jgi:hypothetical protein
METAAIPGSAKPLSKTLGGGAACCAADLGAEAAEAMAAFDAVVAAKKSHGLSP